MDQKVTFRCPHQLVQMVRQAEPAKDDRSSPSDFLARSGSEKESGSLGRGTMGSKAIAEAAGYKDQAATNRLPRLVKMKLILQQKKSKQGCRVSPLDRLYQPNASLAGLEL